MSLSHVDEGGKARMVDVSGKSDTSRTAVAIGMVRMSQEACLAIAQNTVAKGDVLGSARIAGVMGAKRTAGLIPLCHPLPLDQIVVDAGCDEALPGVRLTATARATTKTGVEMEALVAVSIACLTVYDMAKALDPQMVIEGIRVHAKRGGKHDWSLDDTHATAPDQGA